MKLLLMVVLYVLLLVCPEYDRQKIRWRLQLSKHSMTAQDVYTKKMIEFTDERRLDERIHEDHEFVGAHEDAKRISIEVFNQFNGGEASDDWEIETTILEGKIEKLREQMMNQNTENRETEMKRLQPKRAEAIQHFKDYLKECCEVALEDGELEEEFNKTWKISINKFLSTRNDDYASFFYEEQLKLEKAMEQLKEKYRNENERKQKADLLEIRNKTRETSKICAAMFQEKYLPLDALQFEFERFKEDEIEKISDTEIIKGKCYRKEFLIHFEKEMERIFYKLKLTNERNKEKELCKFKQKAKLALEIYSRNIKHQTERFVKESELHNIHMKWKTEAMNHFESKDASEVVEPKEDYQRIRDDLLDKIGIIYDEVNCINNKKKKKRLEALCENLPTRYEKYMNQLLGKIYVKPSFLEEKHKKIMSDLMAEFEEEAQGLFTEMKENLDVWLESQYKEIIRKNLKRKLWYESMIDFLAGLQGIFAIPFVAYLLDKVKCYFWNSKEKSSNQLAIGNESVIVITQKKHFALLC